MNHKIFFVNKSEIEGRLDSEYYSPDISKIEAIIRQKSTKNLAHFAYFMASGGTPNVTEESYYFDKENGIPFLRVQNLTEQGVLNLDGLKYISKDVHENMLKRSQFDDQDLLVKITGVGRMAVASVPSLGFVGNTNQHMVVIKTKNRQISEYLANYLNLDIVEKLAKRRSTGGTRPALDYVALRSIPIIENLDFSKWDNAKMQAQNIQNQAQTLLNSISDYLLEQLGIVVPSVDNALNNRIFMTSFSELDERLDPNFYFYRGIKMTDGHFKNIELDKIAHLIKGTSLSSKNVIDGEYPVIAGGQTSPYNHHIYNFDGETITVSASGAYSGYVTYHNYPIFASDCTVIKTIDNNEILPQFLFEILKLKQDEIYRLQKGAAQPHVYANDLAKIKIPLPDMDTQKSIVQHINQIRQQAQALEQEAIDLLKQAQDEIEMMILR
ncbi:hypothetical protein AAX05_07860 [Moraxella bovoculi]|uniref:Type I restriction modification DNA specificity domain-containing protein n=1 Tax=Moraxella bovoculi TaxID=386891 RepID=A0AAC8T9F5_9GAMM|nr:restriction endonuclease subunit S [Moraxella bovoculi]AKG07326.1 hypothetical protein AAX06_03100 [Moraxella bovoculi]AKG10069.1 hypothetical protein AAX05_07860 [Moraxella bovoculi]AKG11991.1 hypothetical protein AAX07_08405 [Moraxella bovoculi]AKG13958.1 hypothetical protein AAX11_07950 [Moraxella bovoculi]